MVSEVVDFCHTLAISCYFFCVDFLNEGLYVLVGSCDNLILLGKKELDFNATELHSPAYGDLRGIE